MCSNQRKAMLDWAWVCAGYIELDFGLGIGLFTLCNSRGHLDLAFGPEIGKRLDRDVYKELECGKMVHDFESWGKEDGHHCNKAHSLLAPKAKKGKGKAKRMVEIIEN